MTATLRLQRTFPTAIWDRHPWKVVLDAREVATIQVEGRLELDVEPGRHTVLLRGKGRRKSPERGFEIVDGGVVGFVCHPQPILPLALWAYAVPTQWIVLQERRLGE
ncbi:hypothetical protein [Streptacidiphilus anmyonensis]|uniref:hypothetical protein n=1 Tax=Streptacidiphilus anmyonensis TaxID=405782 RepID=UPI0005AB8F8F|nr:hypothetical protein [Streptacidiphilus anmyonensis]